MKKEISSIKSLLIHLHDRLKPVRAIASKFFRKGNLLQAVDDWKLQQENQNKQSRIIHNSPDNSEPSRDQLEELINLYNQGNFLKFLPLAEQIAKDYSHNFQVHIMLAEVNRKLQNHDAAIENYQKAIQIKPDYTDAYMNLGITLKNSGQLISAVSTYKKILDIKPDDAETYYNIGNTFQVNNDLDAAVEYYQKAINSQPAFPK